MLSQCLKTDTLTRQMKSHKGQNFLLTNDWKERSCSSQVLKFGLEHFIFVNAINHLESQKRLREDINLRHRQ